jgi:DNA-binding MarR family transcriptional regulator
VNAIFFGAKRAFQSTLRITRPWLTRLGLTAARFDMLTAIARHPYGLRQRDLRRRLGVTAPTVSRMLRSLEELRLVHRHRDPCDRRQVRVDLTDAGRARIHRASVLCIDTGAAQLAVDCALVGGEHTNDESRCMTEMAYAECLLDCLRSAFRDLADLYYPWHPDD